MKLFAALCALFIATTAQAATHNYNFTMHFKEGDIGPVESATQYYDYISITPGNNLFGFKVGHGLDKTVDGQTYSGRLVIDDTRPQSVVHCTIAGAQCFTFGLDLFEDRPGYTSIHIGVLGWYGYEFSFRKDGSGTLLENGILRVYGGGYKYGIDPVTGESVSTTDDGLWLCEYDLTMTSVPLPATSLMLIAGIAALAGAGLQRKRTRRHV
ncbi:hypothetical protein ACFSZS_12565 [Seohaeicola zhoushanensis]